MIKLPLDIRQNYTTRPTKSGDGWFLKCDSCGKTFNLLKPPPGMPVEAFGLRMVRTHMHSHHGRYYSVAQVGEQMVAAHLEEMTDEGMVKHVEDAYIVHVRADNLKHAITKGMGIIRASLALPSHRRTWRDNFRR